jgi:hypothetical protein
MGGTGGVVDGDHAIGLITISIDRGLDLGNGHDLGTQRAHDLVDISPQGCDLAAWNLARACFNYCHAMSRRRGHARD